MIDYDLTLIKAIMFDVDGVLSRETINTDFEGEPMRTVNIKDGYAIQLAVKLGLRIAIITGGNAEAIRQRYSRLGVEEIHLGSSVKIDVMRDLMKRLDLKAEEIMFMGDDIPDYEVLRLCGCPCCPADAASEIKAVCRYISRKRGGEGCVRDIIEHVLRAQNKWNFDKTAFGW